MRLTRKIRYGLKIFGVMIFSLWIGVSVAGLMLLISGLGRVR